MNPVATLLTGKAADLGGGLTVLRAVPQAALRSIGPFVFVDHFGPTDFAVGAGMDVRPHPHIGLATITWLFDGEIIHRDSLGSLQPIAPGDVNWMVAGRGIVHSERTAPEKRAVPGRLHGMQTWIALPAEHEDDAPLFEHHPGHTLPLVERDGVSLRIIAGHGFGARSPVGVYSPMLYGALELAAGARFVFTAEHEERALYVASGAVDIDGQAAGRGTLAQLAPGIDVTLTAEPAALVMLLGGAPVGPRFLWWNFVASTRERIDAARAEWSNYADPAARGRFGSVPGEHEFIPLPAR